MVSINQVIRFRAQTAGQDKLCRTVQYLSQLMWWYCKKKGWDPAYIAKLQDLQSSLSMARKYFALGKSMDHVRSASATIHLNDPFLRYSITLSNISQAFQVLFDHAFIFSKLGFLKFENKAIQKHANKFWLYADILNIFRACYEIHREVQAQKVQRNQKYLVEDTENQTVANLLNECVSKRPEVFLDLLKNVCDVFLPLNSLEIVRIGPGMSGVLGTISSLLGAMTVWDVNLKLSNI